MKKLLTAAAVIVVLLIGAVYFVFFKTGKSPSTFSDSKEEETSSTQSASFGIEKKSAHYESNTPTHGVVLAEAPVNVVVNFNFDLAAPSAIKIEKGTKDYGIGQTSIDENKLTMRRQMDPASPDGVYTVNYNACWPDKSCHDGSFQFAIDRTKSQSFEDFTGQKEVTVTLSEIQFKPQNIKIEKGTKVTWINQDDVDHYINTDSHPAHTYFPQQNSQALGNGDTYSVTFNTPGIYPYHCSAHPENMAGAILVV